MAKRPKEKQVTAHLDSETKEWFSEYANGMRMADSEAIRLLIERERQVRWLKWALSQKDPEQDGESPELKVHVDTVESGTET